MRCGTRRVQLVCSWPAFGRANDHAGGAVCPLTSHARRRYCARCVCVSSPPLHVEALRGAARVRLAGAAGRVVRPPPAEPFLAWLARDDGRLGLDWLPYPRTTSLKEGCAQRRRHLRARHAQWLKFAWRRAVCRIQPTTLCRRTLPADVRICADNWKTQPSIRTRSPQTWLL